MKYITLLLFLTVLLISCTKNEAKPLEELPSTSISHFDYVPDTLITDSLLIDLNGDNLNDVKLEYYVQGLTHPNGLPYNNFFARCVSVHSDVQISLGTEVDPSQRAWDCLEINDPISSDLSWEDSFELRGNVHLAGFIGFWDLNDADGYLGVKIESPSSTTFGWIKVNVQYNSSGSPRYDITCFDFAVSDTCNETIYTGQTE